MTSPQRGRSSYTLHEQVSLLNNTASTASASNSHEWFYHCNKIIILNFQSPHIILPHQRCWVSPIFSTESLPAAILPSSSLALHVVVVESCDLCLWSRLLMLAVVWVHAWVHQVYSILCTPIYSSRMDYLCKKCGVSPSYTNVFSLCSHCCLYSHDGGWSETEHISAWRCFSLYHSKKAVSIVWTVSVLYKLCVRVCVCECVCTCVCTCVFVCTCVCVGVCVCVY